jgi:subtilisin-like proprotein convertase family protein
MRNFTRLFFIGFMILLFSNFGIAQQSPKFTTIVGKLIRTTPKLADIDKNSMYGAPIIKTRDEHGIIGRDEEEEDEERPARNNFASKVAKDMALQNSTSPSSATASSAVINQNFDGLFATGFAPSDNNMAVGPNHVIQIINHSSGSLFKIWNKAGVQVQAQTILSTITGISGAGDPVVMYDQIADRWILTEFSGASINVLVWAVSTTPDPTGPYKIYSYTFPYSADYPHYSVWHNAYYGITHDFQPGYVGSSIYAFDKAAMIAGAATATAVSFRFDNSVGPNVANRAFTMLPVHQEGSAVSNQSGLFTFFQDDSDTPDPLDVDSVFTFTYTPNFTTPALSVISPMSSIVSAPFNSTLCGSNACITQTGGGAAIRGIDGQLMHKVGYRNFGGFESMVANFTTNAGTGIGGIRWWELRRTGGAGNWSMYQQGTYAPGDGNHRFMGSIAQNALGDIGLIFNVTGPGTPATFPSFRLTGRTTCDPLGQMTIPETSIIEGTVINGTNRYGDYNALQTDPTGNSFWGTGQYNITGLGTFGNWATRMVNFSITGGAATITSQPANTSVCVGTTASFTVAATGGAPLGYQWQVSTNGGATWTNIPGATATTYSFTAVAGDNGKQFRCNVTSACPLLATSNAATLTITTLSSGGNITPASSNACPGPNSTTLTLSGSVGNILQWESSVNGGITWTVIANTTTTLTATNLTQTTLYRALVQSSGCSAAYSSTATITFIAAGVGALTIVTDNGTTLCAGDPTLLTATLAPSTPTYTSNTPVLISSGPLTGTLAGPASPYPSTIAVSGLPTSGVTVSSVSLTGLSHTWSGDLDILLQSPTGQNVILLSDFGGSNDFINANLTFSDAGAVMTAINPMASGTFKCVNTAGPDVFVAPGPGSITNVNPTLASFAGDFNGSWKLFVVDQAGGDTGRIAGGYNIKFSVAAGSLPPGLTYVWSPAAGLNATNTNPVAASPNTSTTYTVLASNSSGCSATASIAITVNQRPRVTTQPANVSACDITSATFSVTATGTGISYQWQVSTNGGSTYIDLSNTAPYSGVTTANLTINPVAAAMNNNRYRCVISGICSPAAISNGAILTIKALPIIPITPPGPVCGGVAGINGTLLSAGSSAPPIPGTATFSSGTISVAVPDNTAAGVSTNLNVSGIPANATITGVRVTLNMPHTYCGDMLFNLKAPNNSILALDKYLGGTGNQAGPYPNTGFVNAVISSSGVTALSSVTTQPITGTFKADLINGPVAGATVQNPAGFVSNATAFSDLFTVANGTWTLAMADGGPGDVGTLTSWSIVIDYTTPGATGSPLTYTWAPANGLYTNSIASIPYIAGTQTNQVYAAPTTFTTYTVSGIDATTGCVGTSSVLVNYTPPAPNVTPNPVTMCLGDNAVKLKSSSSTTTIVPFSSGPIAIPIIDNSPGGTAPHTINVSGIPAGAAISAISVNLNLTHTYVGDMSINLKAPNGNILNLDRNLSATGNPGANFVNTVISSAGIAALSSGTQPFTGTFKADKINGVVTPGYNFGDPTGFIANAAGFSDLYSVPNGAWTIAMADNGLIDIGTFNSWTLTITYVLGVPAAPAVWSPAAGLFSDANASTAYIPGTAVDSVWTKPTPSGVYNYQVTVNSLPPAAVTPTTNFATGNGQALVTFNVRNNNAYPVTLSSISSACLAAGSTTATAFYKTTAINGLPGAISAANGWTQLGTGTVNVATALAIQPLLTGLNLTIPPNTTYGIAIQGVIGAAANISYSTLAAGTYTFSAGGCDIISGTNIGYGGVAAPGAPTFTPRGFIGSVSLIPGAVPACTSPARTVVVTVNQPVSITTQPVNAAVCTDKVTSFTVVAAGTTPTHNWRVSTDNGNTWSDVSNGGVYAGAKTGTLTITSPPVSMNGYLYKDSVVGASPCGFLNSAQRLLTVNPLPTITISASPLKILPGVKSILSSSVTPAAATYTWLKNGLTVANANAGTLLVNIDGLGDYRLRVTDVNGCSNISNQVTISDSISGKVFIYPNPNNGQFQVRYNSSTNITTYPRGINIYDSRGKRIATQAYPISGAYARMDVDLRNYGTGVYWIEVVDLNGNRLAMGRAEVIR